MMHKPSNKLLKILYEALSDWKTEEGYLNKVALWRAAQDLDPKLMRALRAQEELRAACFKEVEGVCLFKRLTFYDLVNDKAFLPDNYTSFAQSIGLSYAENKAKRLIDQGEVVLNFPYKDCLLEGGQSKDEKQQRKERFWNETLAPEEVNRLLSPKVLTQFRRYRREGEAPVGHIDPLQENWLIKGNNLLALHTLKAQFAGKIKLIYIDPPYNTGNDSFRYNDRFSHSSWLVFMKDRLRAARHLLRDDGVIFVQCDDNEQAYLKVLMDEIFGRDNFVASLVWRRRKTQANLAKWIAPVHEYILLFARNKPSVSFNRLPLKEDYLKKMYSNPDNDTRGLWATKPIASPANAPNKEYVLNLRNGRQIKAKWRCSQATYDKYLGEDMIVIPREGEGMPRIKVFLSENKGYLPNTWLDDVGTNEEASKHVEILFGSNDAFHYSKPEGIIQHILQIGSEENDLVLDFCAGSGTTAAVAHKMGRRWVAVEQMDYIKSVTAARLQKVLEGEQGGISAEMKWQGGGSFVYCELMMHNERWAQHIEAATDPADLQNIWQQMKEKADLIYRLPEEEYEKVSTVLSEAHDLEGLKALLKDLLDKNMLYVPYSEINDASYQVPEEEKALNHALQKRAQ